LPPAVASNLQAVSDTAASASITQVKSVALLPWFLALLDLQVGREALSLMVPCADMANHSMQPNAAYMLEPDSQTFSITATEVRQQQTAAAHCLQSSQQSLLCMLVS
jgi:hypothetical protein